MVQKFNECARVNEPIEVRILMQGTSSSIREGNARGMKWWIHNAKEMCKKDERLLQGDMRRHFS